MAEPHPHPDGQGLRLLLESLSDGVWTWDPRTDALSFSEHWAREIERRHGRTPVTMGELSELIHPRDLPRFREALREHMDGATPCFACEHRLRLISGKWAWIETRGRALERDGSGAALRLTGVQDDITDRKLTEDRLAQYSRALEAANSALEVAIERADAAAKAKTDFLANMSHEIRTPMTAVLGYTETLRDRRATEEERHEAIRDILRNGRALMGLIDDILDVSRMEEGKLDLHEARVPLGEFLEEIRASMNALAREKGLAFDFHCLTGLPARVRTDPDRLRQILENVIENAIKFTEEGNVRVEIGFTGDRPGPGDRRAGEATRLEVSVTDTGVGMDPPQLGRIFLPFTQADESATRRHGGAGLGLAISKRLANLMGGDIRVATGIGAGSRFDITIPVEIGEKAQAPAGGAAAPRPPGDPSGGNGPDPLPDATVLLAEDVEASRKIIGFMLEKWGLRVVYAANGRVAVDRVLKPTSITERVDLVLMDMQMPEMDGYTATRTLRESGCELPIVALTAHSSGEEKQKCLAAGCNTFTTKPIHRDKLLEILRSNLAGRAAA